MIMIFELDPDLLIEIGGFLEPDITELRFPRAVVFEPEFQNLVDDLRPGHSDLLASFPVLPIITGLL